MAWENHDDAQVQVATSLSSMPAVYSLERRSSEHPFGPDELLPLYEDLYADGSLVQCASRRLSSTCVRVEYPQAALMPPRQSPPGASPGERAPKRQLSRSGDYSASLGSRSERRNSFHTTCAQLLERRLPASRMRDRLGSNSCDEMEMRPWNSSYPLLHTESVVLLQIRSKDTKQVPKAAMLSIRSFATFDIETRLGRSKRASDIIFDDETLFQQIRHKYAKLRGPFRLISARCLQRIVVLGRSPDDFTRPSEEQANASTEVMLLQLFERPAVGRGSLVFTQWARRVANVPTSHLTEMDDGLERQLATEGLEFVVAWSSRRVIFVLVTLVAICIVVPVGISGAMGKQDAPAVVTACTPIVAVLTFTAWLLLSWTTL